MMSNYKDYIDSNVGIIKFIYYNDLMDQIQNAVNEANEISNMEVKQFRHSYYFSKIYNILDHNNLDKLKTSSIVNIIENPYNKRIDEIINDYKNVSYEASI